MGKQRQWVLWGIMALTQAACASQTPASPGAPEGAGPMAMNGPSAPTPEVSPGPSADSPNGPAVGMAAAPAAGPPEAPMAGAAAPSGASDGPMPAEPSPVPDSPAEAEPMAPFDYEQESLMLTGDLVIAPGETLRVGPGSTLTASAGVMVRVEGTLIVAGTADAPVRFAGAGLPRSWHGVVIADGGRADLAHVEISGATYGIHAQAGSQFTVAHADIGKSFKAAVVESDGSFAYTRFHASGDVTFSAVSEVSIDDVNGTLTILDASPTVSHSSFDGGFALVDMIRVGGDASPVFDHIHVRQAHCGIHAFGGDGAALQVKHSVFEGLAYGLMAYTTAPVISDSVFMMNATDVGYCFEATQATRPTLSSNYYSSGAPAVDASCFQVGTTDASPATAADPMAGPLGL